MSPNKNQATDKYRIAEAGIIQAITKIGDSGPFCSDDKFPAEQSNSSGKCLEELPEYEMESAAVGQLESRNMESDATDDENARTLHLDKAETDDAAVGGEIGDTTDEEEEVDENVRVNRSVQGSHNKNDPIEIDDSDSPSGNNEIDGTPLATTMWVDFRSCP